MDSGRSGSTDCHRTLNKKDENEVLRKLVDVCGKSDTRLPSKRSNALSGHISPNLSMSLVHKCYQEVKEVMRSHSSRHLRVKKTDQNVQSFVRNSQVLFGKTKLMLNGTTLMVYPVHAIVLSFSARKGDG